MANGLASGRFPDHVWWSRTRACLDPILRPLTAIFRAARV